MKGGHEARSSSSCAACKLLKRRCSPDCVFAPYFRSDDPRRFAKVHKVFGASNVSKILVEVPAEQREDTVNSLVFEAEARLRDPVYGCIGAIALLQRRMDQLQHDLAIARTRLAHYASKSPASSSSSSSSSSLPIFLLDDLPIWNGLVDCVNQDDLLESNQSGCLDELSQGLFRNSLFESPQPY